MESLMKRYTIAVGAILLLALSACSGVSGKQGAAPAAPADQPSAVATTKPVAPTPTTPPKSKVIISSWGQEFAYDNGLAVVISQPVAYIPSEYAAVAGDSVAFARFDVTVTNKTEEAFEPSMFQVDGTSDGKPMQSVFDTENGLNGPPSAAVLPGKSVTFSVGFGLANPADITLDVRPGLRYVSTYWQGVVG
jgi:hypothetical protein